MKKLSLLIVIALLLSIGGVYATWVYNQSEDVADITGNRAIALTEATFEGAPGTFAVDTSGLSLTVDPKAGTSHVTSLVASGNVVITFTPSTHATGTVKESGITSYYYFTISNDNWLYDGQQIMRIVQDEHNATTILGGTKAHQIVWTKENGVFKCTIPASVIAEHISLTEFTLDTKAKYDAYDAVLPQGQVIIHISDGLATTPATPPAGT